MSRCSDILGLMNGTNNADKIDITNPNDPEIIYQDKPKMVNKDLGTTKCNGCHISFSDKDLYMGLCKNCIDKLVNERLYQLSDVGVIDKNASTVIDYNDKVQSDDKQPVYDQLPDSLDADGNYKEHNESSELTESLKSMANKINNNNPCMNRCIRSFQGLKNQFLANRNSMLANAPTDDEPIVESFDDGVKLTNLPTAPEGYRIGGAIIGGRK